jgi:hypothetical protein
MYYMLIYVVIKVSDEGGGVSVTHVAGLKMDTGWYVDVFVCVCVCVCVCVYVYVFVCVCMCMCVSGSGVEDGCQRGGGGGQLVLARSPLRLAAHCAHLCHIEGLIGVSYIEGLIGVCHI